MIRKRRSSLSSSSSSSKQKKVVPPSHGSNEDSGCRQLAVVPPTTTAITSTSRGGRFRLPKGWRVEEMPRADFSHVDRYYYEPGTGIKFRSLRAVERHLTGEEYYSTPRAPISRNQSSIYPRMIISNGKMLRLDEEASNHNQLAIVASSRTDTSSPYNLPDGWVVEEVPRRRGGSDRYFYEPGTGRKFRSQISAQRYLAELNKDSPISETPEVLWENAPLSKMFKVGYHEKNCPSWKKKVTGENTRNSSFVSPPIKINWVIASPQGDAWNPFIGEALIPDSVKNQWTKRFMLFMNNGNNDAHAQDSSMQS